MLFRRGKDMPSHIVLLCGSTARPVPGSRTRLGTLILSARQRTSAAVPSLPASSSNTNTNTRSNRSDRNAAMMANVSMLGKNED